MNRLLLLTASTRGDDSSSGKLADTFIKDWRNVSNSAEVKRRDLIAGQIFTPDHKWVEANLLSKEERGAAEFQTLATSDDYIGDLKEATHIVISIPTTSDMDSSRLLCAGRRARPVQLSHQLRGIDFSIHWSI